MTRKETENEIRKIIEQGSGGVKFIGLYMKLLEQHQITEEYVLEVINGMET